MLVTLPVLLLLLDLWPSGRWERLGAWRALREKLPLFALSVASGVATLFAQQAGNAVRSIQSLSLGDRLANAAKALFAYPWKTLWPTDLAVFYPHPGLVDAENFHALSATTVLCTLAAVALTALLWRVRRRRPELIVGWAWYVVMLLPVIGVLQVGAQWMADRYAYLPTVGLYLMAVFGVDAVLPRRVRPAGLAVGLALALACVPRTRDQIAIWRDTRTLFAHALEVTERNYVALLTLGYLENGLAADLAREDTDRAMAHLGEAERHYRATLAVAPRLPEAHNNLASALLSQGKMGEAREHIEEALRLNPRFTKARLLLAMLERSSGDPEAALRETREAVRLDPESVDARLNLAGELERRGAGAEALSLLREAVSLQPSHGAARVRLSEALAKAGDSPGALAQLEAASASASPNSAALEALVWLLATTKDKRVRDPDRAYRLARRLGDTWPALMSKAAAYAAVGEYDTAYNVAIVARDRAAATRADSDRISLLVDMVSRFKNEEALWR